jgi:hypothetical protein
MLDEAVLIISNSLLSNILNDLLALPLILGVSLVLIEEVLPQLFVVIVIAHFLQELI